MNFKDYLKENARKVDQGLDEILLEFLKETKKTNTKLLPFAESLVNSCKGGKRIRGVLCKLGYEIAQGVILRAKPEGYNYILRSAQNDSKEILKVAAAFEILHTALLIHDDIIDQSPKRRGQPSLYTALGGNHYGISQAISIGDIGLYLPIRIITQTSFKDSFKLKAINYFSQILINTGWGQVMDVEKAESTSKGRESSGLSSKPTFEVTEFINLYKTAKYTIAGPLQIGAILGGASSHLGGEAKLSPRSHLRGGEQWLKKLGEFGENAGIAFQIQDDILDGEITSGDARSQALEYASKAKKIIPQITKDKNIANLLGNMCQYLVERSK